MDCGTSAGGSSFCLLRRCEGPRSRLILNSKHAPHPSANCTPFWPARIEVQSRLESSSARDRLHLGFHFLLREPSFYFASINPLPGGRLLASDRIYLLGIMHAAKTGSSGNSQISTFSLTGPLIMLDSVPCHFIWIILRAGIG